MANKGEVTRFGNLVDRVIPINKSKGISTYDCIRKFKKVAPLRRVGHAGSLDPLATGLVLILTGEATKLSGYLMDMPKRYRAIVRMGQKTDTQDAAGNVVEEGGWEHVKEDDLRETLKKFLGRRKQVPPMYSALKHKGVPLYILARKGEKVEREAREVETYSIELLRFDPPIFEIDVHCSRGLYLRVLAEEIGEALGVPSHLHSLVREEIGHFSVNDSIPDDRMEELVGDEEPGYSLSEALKHLKAMELTPEEAARLKNGIAPKFDGLSVGDAVPGMLVRLIRPDGSLGAIAEVGRLGELSLKRVFN